MKIPFFDYPKLYLNEREDFLRIFDDTCSKGAYIMQKDLDEFEKNLAIFAGCEYAVGVGNATDALEMCLMEIGLKPGDEVIISAHTMLATASSIKMSGGIPVPVDISEEDNLIDTSAIEDAINENTVGIMPTQLNGRICNMDKINEVAKKINFLL